MGRDGGVVREGGAQLVVIGSGFSGDAVDEKMLVIGKIGRVGASVWWTRASPVLHDVTCFAKLWVCCADCVFLASCVEYTVCLSCSSRLWALLLAAASIFLAMRLPLSVSAFMRLSCSSHADSACLASNSLWQPREKNSRRACVKSGKQKPRTWKTRDAKGRDRKSVV